jgi:hypothetical protein
MDDRFIGTIRPHLLAGVLRFVQAARRLDGVLRIALIGSLTTPKPGPKDADVLVTVRDDADLAPLATAGRRLQGHAQQQNRGADIFLCSPAGVYLGRICHWKVCRPGVRSSCDAQHCGRRPFLHDDLQDITLPQQLIAIPPLVLWPEVAAQIILPEDVEQILLAPLRAALAADDGGDAAMQW